MRASHSWRHWVVVAVLAAGAGLPGRLIAQQAAPAPLPDIQKLGPQVGARIPAFTLPDQQGQPRTLASLMGPKGLMLVFHRSADWCPYCKAQLVELQARSKDLQKAGIGVAAISYDPVPVLADFSRRLGVTIPLLSDEGSATIKSYGILNTTISVSDARSYGIPFPGTFLVDPQLRVTSRHFEQAYQERVTVGSLLARSGTDLDVPATAVSSPQLNLTTFATSDAVAVGTHFSIVLDVTPARGMHVYAPGVTGYKPIAITIDPQAGLIVRGAQYPSSETYHFKPLDERVQVYQRPFRVVQDLMVDPSPAGQAALRGVTALTIKGTLQYQACDDKICFTPQSVPLSWAVTLRPLDRVRAVR